MSIVYLTFWVLLMCQPGYKGYSSKWDGTQKVFKVFGYALSISSILILFVMWQWEINWISIVISSIGLVLQRWARETLGSYYTIKLCIQPGQKLIKTGPYKYMDHPGYLGMVLFVVGECLSYSLLWIVAIPYLWVLMRRIRVENEMLKEL